MHKSQPQNQPTPNNGLTFRAILTGIISVAIVAVLVTWAELVLSSVRIGYLQLPPVAIALLLAVIAIAAIPGRLLHRRLGLTAPELAIVYIMCLIGAMVASHGILQKTIPLLVVLNYSADHSNNWARLFFDHVPRWAMPWNTHGDALQPVAKLFYDGLPRGGSIPWGAWAVPCLVWAIFWSLIAGAFLCLAVILRKQWINNEKLSFPLAQLPIEIILNGDGSDSNTAPSFWRNPLTWIGIAIPVGWYGIDWLHQFYPTVPLIPTSITINDYLTGAASPWSQLDYTPLIFSFAALGFFYLLPSDILFSVWFFFLLARAEQMIAVNFNMDTPRMPMQNVYLFQGYQTVGAYIVFAIYLFLIAKPHLARVWAAAIGKEKDIRDGDMLSYRQAVWGLIGCMCGAAVFLAIFGMSIWFAALELIGAILIIGIVMARSTAEAGMLMTEVTWSPVDICAMTGNIHALGASNLALAPFVDHLIVHDQRGLLLTGMLDSEKIAGALRLKPRALLTAILIGILVAVAVAGPLQIWLPYSYGGQKMDYWMENLSPQTQFTRYAVALTPGSTGLKDQWQAPVFFAMGVIVTIFLVAMRSIYYWWPLHPLGYALAGSWSTIQFWFPCLIAWILKSLTIRYGGMSLYTRARPLFLGLVVGEFGAACTSALVSVLVYQTSHQRYHIPTPPFPLAVELRQRDIRIAEDAATVRAAEKAPEASLDTAAKEGHMLPPEISDRVRSKMAAHRYRQPYVDLAVYEPMRFKNRGQEREIARHLAEAGATVVLRAESTTEGEKSPDAWVDFGDAAYDVEFERVTSAAVNIRNAVNSALRSGKKQSGTILLYIDRGDYNEIVDEVLASVRAQVTRDALGSRKIERVFLMDNAGDVWEVDL